MNAAIDLFSTIGQAGGVLLALTLATIGLACFSIAVLDKQRQIDDGEIEDDPSLGLWIAVGVVLWGVTVLCTIATIFV